jgi:hypothetical protein
MTASRRRGEILPSGEEPENGVAGPPRSPAHDPRRASLPRTWKGVARDAGFCGAPPFSQRLLHRVASSRFRGGFPQRRAHRADGAPLRHSYLTVAAGDAEGCDWSFRHRRRFVRQPPHNGGACTRAGWSRSARGLFGAWSAPGTVRPSGVVFGSAVCPGIALRSEDRNQRAERPARN